MLKGPQVNEFTSLNFGFLLCKICLFRIIVKIKSKLKSAIEQTEFSRVQVGSKLYFLPFKYGLLELPFHSSILVQANFVAILIIPGI